MASTGDRLYKPNRYLIKCFCWSNYLPTIDWTRNFLHSACTFSCLIHKTNKLKWYASDLCVFAILGFLRFRFYAWDRTGLFVLPLGHPQDLSTIQWCVPKPSESLTAPGFNSFAWIPLFNIFHASVNKTIKLGAKLELILSFSRWHNFTNVSLMQTIG